ncbi:hypothetical protein CAPTEDRAFT_190411 [Capitella teleta]|uniref:Tetratricopeptide repeat protein 23-like n=1 Tax=Capitella teleta TaxID=283909 RepID=R7TDN2_CAPTE|nr:hypothetical protein CAPTEDRAFT_190411 [Capitella teleta]|eukprot:ELT89607.1 hypothetical protein CAPTEDRAFT_190411 [Capitella teleta]
MASDGSSDDDFYSDEDTSVGTEDASLMPIVEVPSESHMQIAVREGSVDNANSDDDDDDSALEYEHHKKEKKSQKKCRGRTKDVQHVDMTPPDKHLKAAERKAKKYAQIPSKKDEAMRQLICCTALARIVYGESHWRLANAYVNLAEGYCDIRGYFPQAQMHAEFAHSIMVKGAQLASSSTEKPMILNCLINIHYILGISLTANKKYLLKSALANNSRYSEASSYLSKAEKIAKERTKCHGVTDDEIEEWGIKINKALAKLHAKQQKFALSMTYFEKTLDFLEKKHGPDSAYLIPIYQNLGTVEQSKGSHADQEKAIDYFLQAHSIASAVYKDNSPEVAETAKCLALAYSNVKDETAETSAESYLNDALMIYQASHGPHHMKTIEIQDELARLMIRTERQEEGISMLRASIEPKKEVYGDLTPEVADTWKLIGSTYLSQGDTEKALRALKKCQIVENAVHGSNSKKSKDTQRTIDILMANPQLAAKQKRSKMDELKDRPRFNATVSRSGNVGGFKPQTSY